MTLRACLIVPAAVLCASALWLGQATVPASVPATGPAAAQPDTLRITMMDGSSVAGKLSVAELTIDTKFGTLKIPVDQIRSMTPGLKSHPDYQQRLQMLIGDLSAEAFAQREKAQDELVKLGPEIRGELERQLKTAEAEKEMRLQKILEEFATADGDDGENKAGGWVADDVIVTEGFTVVGQITTRNFAVNSAYGTLQLKLSDVKNATRGEAAPEEIRKTLAVPGNSGSNHTFVASGIRLMRGDQVTITATGQIQMTPFGNMQSGPDGGNNFGTIQPDNIPGGSLIAHVKGNETFKVGSKHSFTATKAGALEFSVAMAGNFSGNEFPGEYTVRIKVVHKQ